MTSKPGGKLPKNSRTGSDLKVRASFSNQLTAIMTVMMTDTPERPGIKYEDFVSGMIDSLVHVSKVVPNGMGVAILQVMALELMERVNGDLYGTAVADCLVAPETSTPQEKQESFISDTSSVPVSVDTSEITTWEVTGSLSDESPLYRLGYSVAEGGSSEEQRRAVLTEAFIAKELPGIKTKTVKEQWGTASSAQRLYAISKFVAWLAIFQGNNKPAARAKWTRDLTWLKGAFYQKEMRFKWPKPIPQSTRNDPFMKSMTPSTALAAVVGRSPLPRTDVVSKIWKYIKKNKLQDSANPRMINTDAKLKEIFNMDQLSMFQLAGAIGKHLN